MAAVNSANCIENLAEYVNFVGEFHLLRVRALNLQYKILKKCTLLLLLVSMTGVVCAESSKNNVSSSDEAGKVEASLNWSAETTKRGGQSFDLE